MNKEELKAGERYNFTLLYTGQSINNKFRFESPTGIHYILGLGDMEAVSPVSAPENGIKNTEATPKYAPCRLFKKGDIVRVVKCKGRPFSKFWEPYIGSEMQVVDNETDCENPSIKTPKGWQPIDAAYLEIVTPVEELEPYSVGESTDYFSVDKDDEELSLYWKDKHPNAKAAAEAECARLNEEYRKKMEK